MTGTTGPIPFRTGDGTHLDTWHFWPRRAPVRCLALAPPLPGGSSTLQLRFLSGLVRSGCHLVSFDYRGHRGSGGRFSVASALDDTVELAQYLRNTHRHQPICAVGTCFGAMPIYAVLARYPGLFDRVAFTSALTSLHQAIPPGLVASSAVSARRWSLAAVAHRIAEAVLPEVESSEEHFGLLRYDRVDTRRFLYEYLCANPLRRLKPQSVDVPTLVVYGHADDLIGLHDAATRRGYRRAFADRFRRISFRTYDDTHFFASSRRDVNAELARFLVS